MKTNEAPTTTPTGSTNEPVPTDLHPADEPDTHAGEPSDAPPADTPPADTPPAEEPVADPTGQLLLLPEWVAANDELSSSNAHARFRLSKQTRERGLRHVAEIRAQLAAAKERHDRENVVSLPPRRKPAA